MSKAVLYEGAVAPCMSLWEQQSGVAVWPSLGSEPIDLIPRGGKAGQGGKTVPDTESPTLSSRTFSPLLAGRCEGVCVEVSQHLLISHRPSQACVWQKKKSDWWFFWWQLYFTSQCWRKHGDALSNAVAPNHMTDPMSATWKLEPV